MTTAEKQARLSALDAEFARIAAERQRILHARARAVADGESAEQLARFGQRLASLTERESGIAAAVELLTGELAQDREREQREAILAAEANANRTRTAYIGAVRTARGKLESFAREFVSTYDGLVRAEYEARMAWDAVMRAASRDRRFERFEVPNALPIDEALAFFQVAAILARYGGSQHVRVAHAVVPPSPATNTSSPSGRREVPASTDGDAVSRHIAAKNAEGRSRPNPLRASAS